MHTLIPHSTRYDGVRARLGLGPLVVLGPFYFFIFYSCTFQRLDKPWSRVSSLSSPPGSCLQFLSRIGFGNPTARRFFIKCCQLTLSRFSQVNFVRKKKSPRIYTSMHSGAFELTKLTYTRLEDNLIRHRGDRLAYIHR